MTRTGNGRNQLRIIGGEWRSRKLAFPDTDGLRPTPDRVRETLFNWLAPVIADTRCLDLFAGSGALGLEALSRGAAEVLFIERDARAAAALEANIALLRAGARGRVVRADAINFLRGDGRPFDLVFLDPPYSLGLLEPALRLLGDGGWLAPGARVYLENGSDTGIPLLPKGWEIHRSQRAGQVAYAVAIAN